MACCLLIGKYEFNDEQFQKRRKRGNQKTKNRKSRTFTVGKYNVGNILYSVPVDLSEIEAIEKIFGKTIVIEDKNCIVYGEGIQFHRSLNNLQIYFGYDPSNSGEMDAKPKLIKIGKKCILKEALSHPKYIVKNGILSFIILPDKGGFHDEFISKYKS
ncbi:16049_t:CDS:2 [Entrophospora sp. SA101]|nr:16049_t:CDS:2 [Entrophospora sp. SA101]